MVRAIGHRAWLTLRARARVLDEDRLAALSPILVIAPHQDDETLGCGGLLATAARLGLRPRLAYLTDGGASHVGSPSWPAKRLVRARRLEALRAAGTLGLGASDVRFLGWSDAHPVAPGQPRYARTLDTLARWARSFAPRGLWTSWPNERHCDHAAAGRLAITLADHLALRPMVMDYLVWGWTEATLANVRQTAWALDCPATVSVRRRALACHRTQLGEVIADARRGFQIPPRLAALTARPTEVYLEAG